MRGNRKFDGQPVYSTTGMDPVAAHVAHIRHLARAPALESLLNKRHGFAAIEARKVARQTAPFIEQALHFLEACHSAGSRVRPVLQYYGYLNLAVACVLTYRPPGWLEYRQHGAHDLSRQLSAIKLGTPAVKIRNGAIPLFHSIISSGDLPKRSIRLRDLLVPIPMLSVELGHAYDVKPYQLSVTASLRTEELSIGVRHQSSFEFAIQSPLKGDAPSVARFPAKRMGTAMPILREHFRLEKRGSESRTYVSKQVWTQGNLERAERFHQEAALKLINLGAHGVDSNGAVHNRWHFRPDTPLMPTMTASLLFSFFLASLCRYRANILDAVENSRFNLLCEVFGSEADGYMIPTFRNLLYGEILFIQRSEFA